MIYSLTGILLEKSAEAAVIECGGVGYYAGIPTTAAGALPAVGERATLYTYLSVTENDVQLFGFADRESKALFQLLIGVSGVGPKAGLAILSALPPDRILLAIRAGDHKTLTAANGVGPKLAQRIVLELKDKAGAMGSGLAVEDLGPGRAAPSTDAVQQAIAALLSLGYSQSEAAAAIMKLDANLPVPEMIRLALRSMGGN